MAETNGNHNPRLDRIEKALELMVSDHEQFRQEHKQLLIAQVVQSDQIAENARQIQALTQRMNQQSKKTAALDERVDKLVGSIGELISRIPPSSLVQ
jgi:flagellar biosynthesis chaperone FliJ